MLKLPKTLLSVLALGSLMLHGAAQADESVVTLKLAHFLPAHSVTQAQILEPWAERITQQSNGLFSSSSTLRCSSAERLRSSAIRCATGVAGFV